MFKDLTTYGPCKMEQIDTKQLDEIRRYGFRELTPVGNSDSCRRAKWVTRVDSSNDNEALTGEFHD